LAQRAPIIKDNCRATCRRAGSAGSRIAPPAATLYLEARKEKLMPVRLKTLIGTFILVALVIVYAVIATAVAVAQLAESSAWVHLLYFFLTGFLWVLPAMVIIKWMLTEPKDKKPRVTR